MIHHASRNFWRYYEGLTKEIQRLADEGYTLLKTNPKHPSLHFKKVGRFWSVRVGKHYRALAVQDEEHLVWFWIGHHSDYDRLIQLR